VDEQQGRSSACHDRIQEPDVLGDRLPRVGTEVGGYPSREGATIHPELLPDSGRGQAVADPKIVVLEQA
jgi:hypothetical protein